MFRTRRIASIITGVVFFSLSAVSVVLLAKQNNSTQTLASKDRKEIVFSKDCKTLEKQVNQLTDKSNYCNKNSDCKIETEIFECPFGCWQLINAKANKTDIQRGIEKYRQTCSSACTSTCSDPPTKKQVVCKNHLCVVDKTK